MEVKVINPTEVPEWDGMVAAFPGCSFFHSSAWSKVLSDSYGYKQLYFTLWQNDRLAALLPIMEVDSMITGRRGVCLPFTDYCDPLATSTDHFNELFRAVLDHGRRRGWNFVEIRGGGEFFAGREASTRYLVHTLNLTGRESDVFLALRDSTRRNIKKSSDNGVSVQMLTTEQGVRDFYRLNQITRREHGLPPQPYRFFEHVYEHVISKGLGFVILGSYQDVPIAAAVYFHFGDKAVYKYGASDKRCQNMRPNNLVMWEAIRWCVANGKKSLSFGRTDLDHSGLRQFKMGWGAEEREMSYYKYDIRASKFASDGNGKISNIGSSLFSSAPLPVLRAIGSLLYRHMG